MKGIFILVLIGLLGIVSYAPSDAADAQGDWNTVIGAECKYTPPLKIDYEFFKVQGTYVTYRAEITAGECKVNTGVQLIPNVVTTDVDSIKTTVNNHIDTWAKKQEKIVFKKNEGGRTVENKGGFTK